ncbi:MAG: hypothetical protein ACXWL5_01045 [Candidatus Chromulinivorax sp.]
MNNSNFTFKINNTEQIIIQIDEYPHDTPYCFYNANFFIIIKNKKIKLCSFSLQSYIDKFISILNENLLNKKQLPYHLPKDIGYLWNLYINADNNTQLSYADQEYTFLDNYYIWYSTFTTWIYNDKKGHIIFEITPSYPHTYSQNFSYQNFLTWMQNYKPLFKTIIPNHVAKQWIEQAQEILDTIDKNTQMLHEQGKL